MGKNPIEAGTIEVGGFTRVYFCPASGASGKLDVDIMFSTTRARGEDPVEKIKDISCRYGIKDPAHMDRTAIVAVPLFAVVDRTVKTVALAKAQEIFTPTPPQ